MGPFSVKCAATVDNIGDFLTVKCSSDSAILSSLSCTYDNSSQGQSCGKLSSSLVQCHDFTTPSSGEENGSFVIERSLFVPGLHSLTVEATSESGETDIADVIFFSVLGNRYNIQSYYNYDHPLLLQV